MPPHRFQFGPDEMVVAAYLVTDGDEAAQAAWKREHPDWFVVGSWTPPVRRSAGPVTGADREGWPSAGRAPGERPARWERAALDFGTALDPASLSVADLLATAAAARAGTMVLRVEEEARVAEARSRGEDRVAPLQAESDLVATSAASVRDKLARYSLNLEHPVGGSKALWFQQALGFTRENSD